MNIKTLLFVSTMALFVVQSCKIDQPAEEIPLSEHSNDTKTNLLCDAQWVLQDYRFDGLSVWDDFDACERDLIFVFRRNRFMTSISGSVHCASEDQWSDEIVWDFLNDEKWIQINEIVFKFDTLTTKRLHVTVIDSSSTVDEQYLFSNRL